VCSDFFALEAMDDLVTIHFNFLINLNIHAIEPFIAVLAVNEIMSFLRENAHSPMSAKRLDLFH